MGRAAGDGMEGDGVKVIYIGERRGGHTADSDAHTEEGRFVTQARLIDTGPEIVE